MGKSFVVSSMGHSNLSGHCSAEFCLPTPHSALFALGILIILEAARDAHKQRLASSPHGGDFGDTGTTLTSARISRPGLTLLFLVICSLELYTNTNEHAVGNLVSLMMTVNFTHSPGPTH